MATCIAFVGVQSGAGTTTLAVNVAAILGVVAHRRTLLLDLSGKAPGVCDHLDISGGGGLMDLATPWLYRGQISTEELSQHVVHYEFDVSALDVLPGFDRLTLSPAEAERVFSYRGVELVNAVCQAARLAGYEYVLLDSGVWQHTAESAMAPGPANAMLFNAEQVVLVSVALDGKMDDKVEQPLTNLRSVGRLPLTVINCAPRLLEATYRARTLLTGKGSPFPEDVTYELVPQAEILSTARRGRRLPAVLYRYGGLGLQQDRFTSALVAVVRRLDPGLEKMVFETQGSPS
jgi:hypothetical protein